MSNSLTLARTNCIWPLHALLQIPGTLPADMSCAHFLRIFPRCMSAMLKRRPCCNERCISIHHGWFVPCVSPQLVCSLRFIVAGCEVPSQSLRNPVLRLVSRSASRPVKQCRYKHYPVWDGRAKHFYAFIFVLVSIQNRPTHFLLVFLRISAHVTLIFCATHHDWNAPRDWWTLKITNRNKHTVISNKS